MNKTIALALMMLLSISMIGQLTYAQDNTEPQELLTFDGKVVSADVSSSILIVRFVNDLTFSVPINTPVKNDIYDIKFTDIKNGDDVTVEYYKDASDKLIATKITVNTD